MFGVYISFPFCRQKCTYCNFASGVFSGDLRRRYLPAVGREAREAGVAGGADTLYLGGGTPSLLDGEELAALLGPFGGREWAEATIETAPGDVTREKARAWAEIGIDRVSLGVQSFDRTVAAKAGRKHDGALIESEIGVLRGAGIERINVDLIAGLAGQSEHTWRADLDWVERLEVEHVSVYMLETDDESRLGAEMRQGGERYGARETPSEEQVVELYLAAVERLAKMGVERYEISNFARRGAESRHNLKYWTMQPYVGIGSDAHSFDGARRWNNVRTPGEYVERAERGESAAEGSQAIGAERRLEDLLMTGLRTMAGVRLEADEMELLQERIEPLIEQGWLARPEPGRLRLTADGILFSNEVFERLIFG